ncbi:hypothetical protein EBESD8_22880 [Rhodococcus aetherivorans]|nr:hypothetical protein EBESD8_22880 [Rhodococcus aetherivorans]
MAGFPESGFEDRAAQAPALPVRIHGDGREEPHRSDGPQWRQRLLRGRRRVGPITGQLGDASDDAFESLWDSGGLGVVHTATADASSATHTRPQRRPISVRYSRCNSSTRRRWSRASTVWRVNG